MKKAALRKQYLIERQRLSDEEVESRSRQIADLFFDKLSQLVVIPADGGMSITIHTFLPIIRNNEINTWFLVRRLWADFPAVRLLAPVTDFGIGLMRHYVITPETVFADNRFGIPEPVIAQGAERLELEIPQGKPSYPADSLPSTQIDLVLVPLLAFDQQGQRVGYGGGFYDRFLSECRANCIKIGLSLFDPVVSIDDVFEGDISLDYCITSQQIWCFQDCTPT